MKDLLKGAALFIGGAMVGAAAALLLTPNTGEEVRQQIAEVAEDAKKKVQEYCEQVKTEIEQAIDPQPAEAAKPAKPAKTAKK